MIDNKILPITENVKWIGVIDKDIVTFDIVMETKYGTTYNSYLINADKKAVVETVKEKFFPVYLEKIKQVTNPSEIEYIIVNHTEPDHSGSVKHLLTVAPNATVVGSRLAITYLEDIIGAGFKNLVVKDGDTLDLGNMTLNFISAPNLHWPDTMYSYLVEDKVLFTCDSFGTHYANEQMYDYLIDQTEHEESFKYYFDVILKPYSKFMLKAIEKIRTIDVKTICNGHGPILSKYLDKYVNLSEQYAKEALSTLKENKVLITYVSAYQFTKQMAYLIADGIKSLGDFDVEVFDIEKANLGDIDEKLSVANAILVGSPTINQNTLLPIYRLFALINPIRDKGKIAATFGSYGWSGEAEKIIKSNLSNLKLNVLEETMFIKFAPKESDREKFVEFGKKFVEQFNKKCN